VPPPIDALADGKTSASAIAAPRAPPPLVVSSSALYAKTSSPLRAARSRRGFGRCGRTRVGTRIAPIYR
jgi:hypothetical protein